MHLCFLVLTTLYIDWSVLQSYIPSVLFLFGIFLSLGFYLNSNKILHLFMLKISSRTLHVPWDEAGCLCPVGDLFNYSAPAEDLNDFGNVDDLQNEYAKDDLDANHFRRLTDGGYEEDAAAYCFYAKKNYKIGDQVNEILSFYSRTIKLSFLQLFAFSSSLVPLFFFCGSLYVAENMLMHLL